MPYIKCPDEKTYSRYDRSEYVVKCICAEKEARIEAAKQKELRFQECMQDPTCKAAHLKEVQREHNIHIGIGITLVILALIIARKMNNF